MQIIREKILRIREFLNGIRELQTKSRKRPFLTRLFGWGAGRDLFSPIVLQVEDGMSLVRERYGEAFWRAHHEAWLQASSISVNIARLTGFRSRPSAIGA
jgi:hypothetical protein